MNGGYDWLWGRKALDPYGYTDIEGSLILDDPNDAVKVVGHDDKIMFPQIDIRS